MTFYKPTDKAGLIITALIKGSPAETAGLIAGDRILKANGSDVNSHENLGLAYASAKEGDQVLFDIERNGIHQTVNVTSVGINAADVAQITALMNKLAKALPPAPTLASSTPVLANLGLVISEVSAGSLAAQMGLQKGDRLQKLNGEIVNSRAEFQDALRAAPRGVDIFVQVIRNGETLMIPFKLPPLAQPAATGSSSNSKTEFKNGTCLAFKPRRQGDPAGLLIVSIPPPPSDLTSDDPKFKVGDRLTAINGKVIESIQDYFKAVQSLQPNDLLQFSLDRGSEKVVVPMKAVSA